MTPALLPLAELGRVGFALTYVAADRERTDVWSWAPATGEVTGAVDGRAVAFRLGAAADDAERAAEQAFLADTFWWSPALHATWAAGAGRPAEPLPPDAAGRPRVVLRYASGGYTPGDAHELALGPAGEVVGWVWRPGGGEPALSVAFGPAEGPLGIAAARTVLAGGDGVREVRAHDLVWRPRIGAVGAPGRPPALVVSPEGCRLGALRIGWSATAVPARSEAPGAAGAALAVWTAGGERTVAWDPATLRAGDAAWVAETGLVGCDWGAADPAAAGAALAALDPADRRAAIAGLWGWAIASGALSPRAAALARGPAARCAASGACGPVLAALRR